MAAPDVAANLWRGACEGGAGALGQAIGRLAPGAAADFVVLDANDADFESARAPAALAIAMFSGNFNRVRDVFVAGRALVEHGHHARESEAAAAYRAALARLRAPNRS
jgi:formimidoylglutamate deiminase